MKEILLLLLLEMPVISQTNQTVIPGGFENQNGNSNDGIFEGASEIQQLYRASSLAQTWQTPVSITGVSFRVADGTPRGYNATVPSVTIRLSTTSQSPEVMSPNYFLNRGSDETTVFSQNNVSLFAAISQPVNPFDLKFQFDQPFVFDPRIGNLLMFIQTGQATPLSGTTEIDSHVFPSLSSSPVAASGTSGPFGSGVFSYALITEFSWTPIPEPSSQCLLITGALLTIVLGIGKRELNE